MIRVVIPTDKPNRTYEFKGKWYAEQEAAIYAGGHFPLPFTVSSVQGEHYPKGEYTLDPQSFAVNDRGRLQLARVKLLPVGGKA